MGRRLRPATVRIISATASMISQVLPNCRRRFSGSILIPVLGGTAVRNAVLIVSKDAGVCAAVGVTTEGATVQVIVAGAEQLSPTGWLNPTGEVTLRMYCAVFPAETEGGADKVLIWKGGVQNAGSSSQNNLGTAGPVVGNRNGADACDCGGRRKLELESRNWLQAAAGL